MSIYSARIAMAAAGCWPMQGSTAAQQPRTVPLLGLGSLDLLLGGLLLCSCLELRCFRSPDLLLCCFHCVLARPPPGGRHTASPIVSNHESISLRQYWKSYWKLQAIAAVHGCGHTDQVLYVAVQQLATALCQTSSSWRRSAMFVRLHACDDGCNDDAASTHSWRPPPPPLPWRPLSSPPIDLGPPRWAREARVAAQPLAPDGPCCNGTGAQVLSAHVCVS